jgi:PAS domain S-box-containing protein
MAECRDVFLHFQSFRHANSRPERKALYNGRQAFSQPGSPAGIQNASMEQPELKRPRPRPRRDFIPYFVLIVGLLTTTFFSYYVWRTSEAKDRAHFNSSVQELTNYVRGRPRLYMEVLRAGTGLFAVHPAIDPNQFHNFVERLELADQYPGAQGIGFLARVKRDQKNSFSASLLRQGVKDFHIWPDHDQDEYNPVIYFEPLERGDPGPIGYDMFTDPVRRAALETARDTGLPAVTASTLVDPEKKEFGFLIFAPVYENDRTPQSVNERHNGLTGFIYSQFRASDFLKAVVAIKPTTDIDVRLYDGAKSDQRVLYDTASENAGQENSGAARFKSATTIDVANRTWTLAFTSRPNFVSAGNRIAFYATAGGGLLMTLLFFGLTRSQVRARTTAERTAAELRISERKVRNTLSDRERAEEALRESEERYRELIENANDIIYTLDLNGNMTSVNKAAELITGYAPEELLSMNMDQLLSPDAMTSSRQMLQRKLAGEPRTNYEVEARSKSGRLVTLEISSRLVTKDGEPLAVQGVARDISKRRMAEEALRQADQRALTEYERLLERITRLAQALGTARDLVTIYRGLREFSVASVPCDGFFVSLYDPARDVRTAAFGWGDGLEMDVSTLPPMPITSEGPNSRAVRSGEIIIVDDYMNAARSHPVVIVGPENGLRPQSSLAAPMAVMGRTIGTIEVQSYEPAAYKEGHVTAMRMAANLTAVAIENVRLLEQESKARAAAEESNRLKDEFLATVSHELRTPLTAILGWSRMLESGGLDQETTARAIETIRRNAKSQSQIINDILDVSRIITGNLYLDLQPVELGPIIETAINVVRPTAEAKGISIETHLDSQPTMVPGDANRLQQVVWNLVSNAIKFTDAGGVVHIAVTHGPSFAEIKVSDNGQGITPEFLPFVFDRFRQADSTTTRRHGGLGLGLAIVRHLVEIHGGSVLAQSAGPQLGSTFTVTLPIVSARSKQNVNKAQRELAYMSGPTDTLGGLQVLVVDDDADTLEVLAIALSEAQAQVTAVPSVAEAISCIMASRPDVIVSDIAMPGQDGYELIKKVRALDGDHNGSIPAIAITAYAREEDRQRALSSGYQDYLPKPVEPGELIAVLAKLAGNLTANDEKVTVPPA